MVPGAVGSGCADSDPIEAAVVGEDMQPVPAGYDIGVVIQLETYGRLVARTLKPILYGNGIAAIGERRRSAFEDLDTIVYAVEMQPVIGRKGRCCRNRGRRTLIFISPQVHRAIIEKTGGAVQVGHDAGWYCRIITRINSRGTFLQAQVAVGGIHEEGVNISIAAGAVGAGSVAALYDGVT